MQSIIVIVEGLERFGKTEFLYEFKKLAIKHKIKVTYTHSKSFYSNSNKFTNTLDYCTVFRDNFLKYIRANLNRNSTIHLLDRGLISFLVYALYRMRQKTPSNDFMSAIELTTASLLPKILNDSIIHICLTSDVKINIDTLNLRNGLVDDGSVYRGYWKRFNVAKPFIGKDHIDALNKSIVEIPILNEIYDELRLALSLEGGSPMIFFNTNPNISALDRAGEALKRTIQHRAWLEREYRGQV